MAKELVKKRLKLVSLVVIISLIEITAENNLLSGSSPNREGIEKTELLYKAGNGKVKVTDSVEVTDEDDINLESAKIQITEGYRNDEDELSFTSINGITGQWDKTSGTLTLSGNATIENYQAALRDIRFENPKTKPTSGLRTVVFIVNDGTDDSNIVSRKISIKAENIAPVLSGIETSDIEYSGITNITSNIVVNDEDNTNLQSAEIKITTGYQSGEDKLSFTDAAGITNSWNAETGTLTITGDAALASYQTALRNVKYENTASTPTAGTRTITFTVYDGTANSNIASRKVKISPANQPPVLAALEATTLTYTEGDGKKAITTAITVTDPNNTHLQSARVIISNGYNKNEDELSFTNANGITADWNSENGTLTLTGNATVAQYQEALRNVQFQNKNTINPSAGARTISFVVNDGLINSNMPTRSIDVVPVNQPPVLASLENTVFNYNEGAGKVAITGTLTITDGDNPTLQRATITISAGYKNGEDVLSFINANGISGAWDAATGTLTLTGDVTPVNYQAALRSIQFENTNALPALGTRTIAFEISDGEAKSNILNRNIIISYTNKPPVLSNIENSNLVIVFDGETTILSTSLTVTDLDNSTLSAATVMITEGYKPDEDILLFTSADNITASWNASTGTLTLAGVSSISNYQKALRNIRYSNLNNSPSISERIVAFTVSDGEANSNNLQRALNFNAFPVASNISIDGTMAVCKTLTGKYDYSDPENDVEDHTFFQWFRANAPDAEKTEIPGANTLTYTLTPEDEGKYIFFEVTPQAKTGSIQGNSFYSNASIKIPNTLPTVTFSGPTAFCEGTSTDLTITFTGTPPFKLIYTDGTNNYDLTSSQLSNKLSITNAGTFKGISLKDNLGCEAQNLPSTAIITKKPAPVAKITSLISAYSLRGVPVALQGSPLGGIFSGKGVVENNTFLPSLAGLEGSPHPIVYTYLDKSSGCSDADTVKVAIIDADASIAGLRNQNQYCNIDIPTIITGVNAGGSIGTFTISGGKGLTDHKNNTATLNTNNLLPGNYTISYAYTQNGTQQLIYETITINLIDNLIVSGLTSPSYCNSAGIIPLTANYKGNFEGTGVDTLKGGGYIYNPRKVAPGNSEVRFSFTNEKGCVITDTIPLKILAATRPKFEANSSCWTNADIAFKNTTLRADSVKAWAWQFGEQSSTTNISALKDPTHKYAAAGSYQVRLVTTNLNNCNDTITSILKLGHKPVADFEWDRPCAGKTEALHINNTTTSTDSIVSYTWTITDGTGRNRTFNSAEITNNFKWDERHTVKLSINTTVGCKDSVVKTLYLSAPLMIKDSTYRESFDNSYNPWNLETTSVNNWKWQLPTGAITTAHSGTMAVFSQFSETKNDRPLVITSPCFDFTGVDRPFIQLWLNSVGAANEEGVILQYRTENSDTWTTAGKQGSGINWYNSENISAFSSGTKTGWTGNTNGWIKANHALDEVSNKKNVRLRMLYKPLPASSAANMFAFDDVIVGNRIKTSLFENFTNLGASNAVSSIQMLNDVLNQSSKDVVSLQYHTSFPGADTLNAANTADPGARVLNYGVGVVPFGLLNGGTTTNLSFDFNARKPGYSDIITQSLNYTPFTMSIATEKAAGNIQGKVIITAQDNYSSPQLGLFTAVVEDVVIQSGQNKITLYNVVKKFLPSAGGSALKADWTKGEQLEIPFNWNFVKVYNPEKVKVVAFIQSGSTKEVLQAASNEVTFVTSTPIIERTPEVKQAVIAPNPATDHARIIFPAPLEYETRIEIVTLNGKVLSSDVIQKDVDIFELETSKMVNGLYLIKLSQKNGNMKIMKLTISR